MTTETALAAISTWPGGDGFQDDPFMRGGASWGDSALNYIPGVGYVFAGPGGFSGSIGGLGGMISGTCFMPGGCPGVAWPSLTQTLTGWIPRPPCDPMSPVITENCNPYVSNAIGVVPNVGVPEAALPRNFVSVCTPFPGLQYRKFAGCQFVCTGISEYTTEAPVVGLGYATPAEVNAACGPGRLCPAMVITESQMGVDLKAKIISCLPFGDIISPPVLFPR
jgi:hypothetical protein